MEVTYLTWTEDNLLRQVSYRVNGRTSRRSRLCVPSPIPLDALAPEAHRTKRPRPVVAPVISSYYVVRQGGKCHWPANSAGLPPSSP